MSAIFNTLNYQSIGYVTQTQLQTVANQKVGKSQLTTTGAANGVLQLTSASATTVAKLILTGATGPHIQATSGNRIFFNDVNGPGSETGTVMSFASGTTTRNLIMTMSKTGTRSGFMGVDSSNLTLGCESTGSVMIQTGMQYASSNILSSGTNQLTIANTGVVSTSAAGSLSVGTGGISTTGKVTNYNGVNTAGLGLFPIIQQITATTGSSNTTLLTFTPTVNTECILFMYAATSAYTSGSPAFQYTYTDGITSNVIAPTGISFSASAGVLSQAFIPPSYINIKANTTFTIAVSGTYVATWSVSAKLLQAS